MGNTATYDAESTSVSLSSGEGSTGLSGIGTGRDDGDANSTTQSAISGLAGNKDARTGDADTGIAPIFDADNVRKDVQAQATITQEFGSKASKEWGDYANEKWQDAMARGDAEESACANLGIVKEGAVTVAVALGAAGVQVEGNAIRADAQANTATAAVVAVVLGDGVSAGQQVDILNGVELELLARVQLAALDGDIAFAIPLAERMDSEVAPGGDRRAPGGVAARFAVTAALAGAQADVEAEVGGVAVCYLLLNILHRQGGVGRCQGLHPRAIGIASRVNLALDALGAVHHGVAEGEAQPALFEALFGSVVAGFTAFEDVDRVGTDQDIAAGGQHVRTDLGVGVTRCESHVAADAAHGGGGNESGGISGIDHLPLAAEVNAKPTAEQATFFAAAEMAVAQGVLFGIEGEVAPGMHTQILVGDDVGTTDADVLPTDKADRLAAQLTGQCLSAGVVGAGDLGFAGEQATAA